MTWHNGSYITYVIIINNCTIIMNISWSSMFICRECVLPPCLSFLLCCIVVSSLHFVSLLGFCLHTAAALSSLCVVRACINCMQLA